MISEGIRIYLIDGKYKGRRGTIKMILDEEKKAPPIYGIIIDNRRPIYYCSRKFFTIQSNLMSTE